MTANPFLDTNMDPTNTYSSEKYVSFPLLPTLAVYSDNSSEEKDGSGNLIKPLHKLS